MAITQAMTTSFKVDLLNGVHDFTNDTFKLALFTSSASLDATTTAYTAPSNPAADPTDTNEVTETGTNYTAGGQALTAVAPTSSGTTAFVDFNDEEFTNVTLTARGALIYNDDQSDKSVVVLDFGSDKTATSGNFTIVFPAADASNAIIRLATP